MRLTEIHPLVNGLVMELPAPGTDMDQEFRDNWLEAANSIFALLYPKPSAPEKAEGTPPAGDVAAASSPAPIHETEAPKPLPDEEEHRPAEAKTLEQEPSVSDGSGEVQDECAIHLATNSPAGKSTRAEAFVAPEGEHGERANKRFEVAALHEQDPWLSPEDAAARLMIPVVNLRIFSTELEIEWSQPRPMPVEPEPPARRKGLQHEVKLLHEEHPDWPAGRIADELHCGSEYVRSAAARLGLSLVRKQEDPRRLTLRDRVATLRLQHPIWTPRMIATELGANLGTVRIYILDAKREPAAAQAIDEAAMKAEAISRKRRLGVAV